MTETEETLREEYREYWKENCPSKISRAGGFIIQVQQELDSLDTGSLREYICLEEAKKIFDKMYPGEKAQAEWARDMEEYLRQCNIGGLTDDEIRHSPILAADENGVLQKSSIYRR